MSKRRPFRSESVVDFRVRIDPDTMIESGIRGEKGLVDARTNVKGKMKKKDAFPEKLRCQGTMRRCNDGCSSRIEWWLHRRYVSIRGKRGRGKKRRWRRSKVRPAGSSPPLTEFYAIYTFESVADDDRGLRRIPVLDTLSASIYGDHWRNDFPSRQLAVLSLSFSLSLMYCV